MCGRRTSLNDGLDTLRGYVDSCVQFTRGVLAACTELVVAVVVVVGGGGGGRWCSVKASP